MTTTPRRWAKAVAVASIATLTLVACGGGGGASGSGGDEPRAGGTLVVGQYQEVTQFDPDRQYSWETWRIDRNIYETLVDEDLSSPNGVPKIIPKLAESWKVSDDATTFTFKLRRDVTFTDGTPFNAEAVEFNVRRFTDPSFEYYDKVSAGTMSLVYSTFDSVKVIDDYTVQYRFKKPYLEFLRLIPNSGNAPTAFFSPTALKQYGQDGLSDHPVGTGPFTFVERIRGDHTTLQRNDKYWGEKPHLDRVIFKPIQNDQSRVAALQTGDVDLISRVPPDSIQSLESAGYAVPENQGVPHIIYYDFNFANKYVQDKRVRQAFIHAIDRKGLAEKIYKGYAEPATSMLHQGNEAFDPGSVDYGYDPAEAQRLIAEAGYQPGEIKINLITDTTGQPTAEWIQQNLKAVGVDATIESFEWITYGTRSANLKPGDALRLGEWGLISPQWVQISYGYSVTAKGGGKYSDTSKTTEAAIRAASSNPNPDKSVALWQAAASAWQKDATVIPLLSFNRYYAISPKVGGFVWPQQDHYDLSKVWLKG